MNRRLSQKNKANNWFISIIVFLGCFSIEISLRNKVGMSIFSDHFGLLASAAKLSGYDWYEVLKLSQYYSPGYFFIFTPLLKFCKDPVIIYNIIVNTCMMVEAFAAVLLYYILDSYISSGNIISNILISIISSQLTLHSLVVSDFGNEQVIVLISLLIALCLCRYLSATCLLKNVKWGSLIVLIVAYSITVHIRNIVFAIGIVSVFLYTLLLYKSDMPRITLSSIYVILIVLISAFLYKKIPDYFSGLLFESWNELEETKYNLSLVYVKSPLFDLIKGFLNVLIGNIYESIIHTYGLVLISYYYLFQKIKELRHRVKESINETINYKDILFVYSSSMYFCGLFAVALMHHGYPRMAGYWRYYGSYACLMLAISLDYAFSNCLNQKLQPYHLLLNLVCFKYLLEMRSWITDEYLGFWYVAPGIDTVKSLNVGLLITFIIAIIGSLILFSNYRYKKTLFTLMFTFSYIGLNIGNGGFWAFTEHGACDTGYKVILELEKNTNLDLDKHLYFLGSDNAYMYYQFMMLDKGISRSTPVDDRHILVFSDKENNFELREKDGWICVELDNNEFVYSKDPELVLVVEDTLLTL